MICVPASLPGSYSKAAHNGGSARGRQVSIRDDRGRADRRRAVPAEQPRHPGREAIGHTLYNLLKIAFAVAAEASLPKPPGTPTLGPGDPVIPVATAAR